MKRSEFKTIADVISTNLERYAYKFWVAQKYPLILEKKFDGQIIQIEISLLELSATHVHLAIRFYPDCYAGIRLPWDPLRPITRTIIVKSSDNGDLGFSQ